MAELEHDPALLQRVAHQLGLGQRPRESLLAVDVFARFHGVEHHLAMPMIRRGDDHRIDVRVGQQFAVIDVGFHLRVEAALDAFLPMRPIDIADRHHLDVGGVDDRVDEVAAAGPQADATDANRLAGGWSGENRRSEGGDGRQRRGRLAGGAEKLTAVQVRVVFHGFGPFCRLAQWGNCRNTGVSEVQRTVQ